MRKIVEKLKSGTLNACDSQCPQCGSQNAIDWNGWDIEGETVINRAVCGDCDCEFQEISQIIYRYTEIT